MKAIVNARNAGAQVVFDPNVRPALWSSKEVMASTITAAATIADIVLPTHTDEAPLFGDASPTATADRYLGLGVGEVAVKNGPEMAVVGEQHAPLHGEAAGFAESGRSDRRGRLVQRRLSRGAHPGQSTR